MNNIKIKNMLNLVKEEMDNFDNASSNPEKRTQQNDHEGSMARSEIRAMLINGMKLYKLIGTEDELPGWVSAYITLSSDYINSVTQYMLQDKIDEDT